MKRRHFLTSASGLLALPALESFSGGRLLSAAETTATPAPRFLTLFFPNGVYPSAWQATATPDGLELGGSLAPLQRHAGNGIVIEGMDHPLPGHLGQTSGFLSGKDFTPDEFGVVTAGTSLDQILAQRWGGETFLPSLNLALEPPSQGGFGNRPRSYGNSISWASDSSKIEPQINPQQAFDQVFFGQTAAGRKAAGRRKRIVDEVWGETKSLRTRLSTSDQRRLDQYLDSIADLESKLQKILHPDQKGEAIDPAVLADRPASAALPGRYEEHLSLMLDVLLLAIQTDSTRVGTLVMGHSISRIVYDFVHPDITTNHHAYSHHRNDPDKVANYNRITKWFSARCADFLDRMAAVDEANGTLLDNSLVLFGSGMKDGNTHDPANVPITLFGSGGGKLQTGRHIKCEEDTILAQLHLTLLHLFGVEAEDFNGVTAKTLSGLV